MVRLLILVAAGLAGAGAAVAYFLYVGQPELARYEPLSKSDREWFQNAMLMNALVVFYAVTFGLCRLGARWFLDASAADEARMNGEIMQIRMRLFAGVYLLAGYGFVRHKLGYFTAIDWLHFLAGMVLALWAVMTLHGLRVKTGKGYFELLIHTGD